MPTRGGAADKFGNRYEGRWTVAAMARVLAEEAESIWLEPWDESGEGIEFLLRLPGAIEHHQVKRQAGDTATWTVARLHRLGVLAAARGHLAGPSHAFSFVSTSPTQLRELAERARSADSMSAFRKILDAHLGEVFRELVGWWSGWSDDESLEALRRLDLVIIDEQRVLDIAKARLSALVRGNPLNAVDVLAAFALDHVHHEINAQELWDHLRERDFSPREWWRDSSILARVDAQRVRYAQEVARFLVAERRISRPVTATVAAAIEEGTRLLIVTGDAGSGKSVVVADAVETAHAAGVAVLPFRVDRLIGDGTALLVPDEVGRTLGLPASPPVVLGGLAPRQPSLLVIDQLDAVSLASGRTPAFFEVVEEMLRQADAYPNMRVLVACRRFDLENDRRLRALRERPGAVHVDVGLLDEAEVKGTLQSLGYDTAPLSARQIALLSVPLNLRLLVDSVAPTAGLTFASANDLFDAFWVAKRAAVRDRLGREPAWTPVIDRICGEMSDRQALTAPLTSLDDWEPERDAMVSEGVLVIDGQLIAFAHEGFFDYAFARRFAASGQDLMVLLRSTEQHLFRRGQVRQVLLHQRGVNEAIYLETLGHLLDASDIRFHIKEAALSVLAGMHEPAPAEWALLGDGTRKWDEPVAARVRSIVANYAEWFDLADASGWFEDELASADDARIDVAVAILSSIQRRRPARVAAILRPHPAPSERWRKRVTHLAMAADLTIDHSFLGWFLELIGAGHLDELLTPFAVNGTFWDLAYDLARKQPAWAAEFAAAYLQRRTTLATAAGVRNPLDDPGWIQDPLDRDLLDTMARGAPRDFVERLLPWMLELMATTSRQAAEHVFDAWSARHRGETYGLRDGLLSGMELALQALARDDPAAFQPWKQRLEQSHFDTANYLLVRALTAAPSQFADEAAELLIGEPARMAAGYMDESHWATRELIAAVAPLCSSGVLHRLQDAVMRYEPAWERTPEARRFRGHAQFVLIGGFPAELLEPPAQRRRNELWRKFQREPEPPRGVEGGFIGSPIPVEVAPLLTDDQWDGAITKYTTDDIDWSKPHESAGGVHQLAQVLKGETQRDPARFARMATGWTDDVQTPYFEAVFQALAETDEPVAPELIYAACRRGHELPGRPCGRWITEPLGKVAEQDLPDEMIDLVVWYATEDPDPAPDRPPVIRGDGIDPPQSVLTDGINSSRGRAALTISRLLRANGSRLSRLASVLEQMAVDPATAVRACAADALLATYGLDSDLTRQLLERLVNDPNDALLATPAVERLIMVVARDNYAKADPMIERMMGSSIPEVATAGGRQACLASLGSADAARLAQSALEGTDAQRLGAAQVYSANLASAELRGSCVVALERLFDDDSHEVRREAATGFNVVPHTELPIFAELIRAFVDSRAFDDGSTLLFHALEEAPDVPATVVLAACRRFVERAGIAAGDIRTAAAADSNAVSRLAVRAYTQGDPDTQREALDLIDRLLAVRAYGLDNALATFER